MNPNFQVSTDLGDDRLELLEIYSGHTKDQIILIREAVAALRKGSARTIEVVSQNKNYTMTVRASK